MMQERVGTRGTSRKEESKKVGSWDTSTGLGPPAQRKNYISGARP